MVVTGLAASVLFPEIASGQNPPPTPADKIQVSASVMEEMQAQFGPGFSSSGPITLLSATFRNSNPADLLIRFTAECALGTDVTVTDTSTSDAKANVKAWVELDGTPVPVTHDSNGDGVADDPDDGRVIFCNRDFKVASGISPAEFLAFFLRTRAGNAFQWGALNVGNGVHTLEVKAQLDTTVAGVGTARAAVGKRVLIVEPTHLEVDATF